MKFLIDEKILEQFPNLNIGVVIAKGIDNSGNNDEISSMVGEQVDLIRSKLSLHSLRDSQKIDSWREAYRSFGAKPKKYSSSVESLYKMVLEGVELKPINKVVDLYNYISLKHMIPVGGDDTDKTNGDIHLTFATGEEQFIRLNSSEIDPPKREKLYT